MREFDVTGLTLKDFISISGNQRKWTFTEAGTNLYVKEQLFYIHAWKDYLVEVIATRICEQLNIDWLRFARYKPCTIVEYDERTSGCYSEDFLSPDEDLETMSTLLTLSKAVVHSSESVVVNYLKLLNTMLMFEIERSSDYLNILFLLDYLLCNTDRHLNNIAVCKSPRGYSLAPMFDFGQGLFQGTYYKSSEPVQSLIDNLIYKPYKCTFKECLKFFEKQELFNKYIPHELDMTGIEFPDETALQVFELQCRSLGITVKGVRC